MPNQQLPLHIYNVVRRREEFNVAYPDTLPGTGVCKNICHLPAFNIPKFGGIVEFLIPGIGIDVTFENICHLTRLTVCN